MIEDKKKKLYDKNIIIFLFLFLIIIAKVIRYTIMKDVLVIQSAGHGMLQEILSENLSFTLFSSETLSNSAGSNASLFFHIINFFGVETYAHFEIYITILWNLLLLFLLAKTKKELTFKELLFFILSILVLNIFCFNLAKEPMQFLYFFLMFIIMIKNISNRWKIFLSFCVILLIAFTFRIYYFLIFIFAMAVYIIFSIFSKKKKQIKFKHIIFVFLALGVFYFLFLNLVKNIDPEIYLELIRVRTRSGEAVSEMINLLPTTNLYYFTIDYLLMIIRMLFPIELLRLGAKYLPYVIYQIIISYMVISKIKALNKNNKLTNLAISIYIGFLLGSAAFEPDFGSWVRHEAVTFPLLLVMFTMIKEKNQKGSSFNESIDYNTSI